MFKGGMIRWTEKDLREEKAQKVRNGHINIGNASFYFSGESVQ